jgi:hypothetical protein
MAVAHSCGGQYGMRKVQGFGETSSVSTFFLQIRKWDIDLICRIGTPEPWYKFPLKPDHYAALKEVKKYT